MASPASPANPLAGAPALSPADTLKSAPVLERTTTLENEAEVAGLRKALAIIRFQKKSYEGEGLSPKTFCLGLTNLAFSAFLLGRAPEWFWLWQAFKCAVLNYLYVRPNQSDVKTCDEMRKACSVCVRQHASFVCETSRG